MQISRNMAFRSKKPNQRIRANMRYRFWIQTTQSQKMFHSFRDQFDSSCRGSLPWAGPSRSLAPSEPKRSRRGLGPLDRAWFPRAAAVRRVLAHHVGQPDTLWRPSSCWGVSVFAFQLSERYRMYPESETHLLSYNHWLHDGHRWGKSPNHLVNLKTFSLKFSKLRPQ